MVRSCSASNSDLCSVVNHQQTWLCVRRYTLVSQTSNLQIELHSRSALLLSNLELALLELSDVSNAELSAEVAKDAILGLVDHGLKRVDTLLQAVMRGLCLRAP